MRVPPVDTTTIRPPSRTWRAACCSVTNTPFGVRAEHAVELFFRVLGDRLDDCDARVRDDDVQRSERARFLEQPPTSAGRNVGRTRPPDRRAYESRHGFLRGLFAANVVDTTAAPSAARRSAIARPMPRELPVTIATFPESCSDMIAPSARERLGSDLVLQALDEPVRIDRRQRSRRVQLGQLGLAERDVRRAEVVVELIAACSRRSARS